VITIFGYNDFGHNDNFIRFFYKIVQIIILNVLVAYTDTFFIKDHQRPSGLNFINVLRTNFSYECQISAAFSSYMYVEKQRSYEKFVRLTLMKLTPSPSIFTKEQTQSYNFNVKQI